MDGERRRLLAWLLGGLLLLTGFTVRQRAERAQIQRVGITATGDTVWLNGSRRDSTYWGLLVSSRDARLDGWYTIAVDCGRRTMGRFGDPRVDALTPQIVDTACAILGRPR